MSMTVRQVGPLRAGLGESPVWEGENGLLYWLDIPGRKLLSTYPSTGATSVQELPRQVHAVRPAEGGGWVATSGLGIWSLSADGMIQLAAVDDPQDGGFNDASVDPAGRLWTGTATSGPEAKGTLYRVSPSGCEAMVPGIVMSNGIGWSPDGATMYYSDSAAYKVYAFDFEAEHGTVDNQRILMSFELGQLPDGLAVDTDGNVWIAVWGGSAVLCVSPGGDILSRVDLPTPHVTSCAFGGPDYRTLFITTANSGPTSDDGIGGALFAIDDVAQGSAATLCTLLLKDRVS